MTFWHFGARIPEIELLGACAKMGTEATKSIDKFGGKSPLPYGVLKRGYRFASGSWLNISIADHSQLGRPMSWYMVRDTISGIGLFMHDSGALYEEVDFWVRPEGEKKDVGWGDVAYSAGKPPKRPAASMSVLDPEIFYITPQLENTTVLQIDRRQ